MYEAIRYARPYLKETIARVDFIIAVNLDSALPSRLTTVASKHFPIVEPIDTPVKKINISERNLSQQQTNLRQWNFYDRDREKQLTLTSSYAFVSCKKYATYENIKGDFGAIIDELQKTFPDVKAARFGLRYINNIEINGLKSPTDWSLYINEFLLKPVDFFENKINLTRLFHVAELKYEDIDIKFQFGMPNPDYPASIKRPIFVLDLDGYVQCAHSLSDSLTYMDKAHEQIQYLFEKSITDKLREGMNGNST